MTNQEFSNEFDVLYNNIMSNQAPGLDEYEKSVFLTKAQDEIIKNHFTSKRGENGTIISDGFDDSEKRQIDFSKLMRTSNIKQFVQNDPLNYDIMQNHFDVLLPTDLLLILNETIVVNRKIGTNQIKNATQLNVIPIDYQTFLQLNDKVYKYPIKRQAWRILTNVQTNVNKASIITGPFDEAVSYTMRYIKKPVPIILVDLPNNLSIDNISNKTECEIDSILHKEILQRAVELAKISYEGDINHTALYLQSGQRSE